jgi:hypothetical protein
MCGPAALNKILGSSSPRSPSSKQERFSLLTSHSVDARSQSSNQERFSLLTSHSVESVEELYYDDMPDDKTPKDDIHDTERNSASLRGDAQSTIFIPQFNVQKAKEHRARQQQKVQTYLPSVAEGSNESPLPSPSFSSISEKFKSKRERVVERESSTDLDIRDQRIESMMKKMQEIIMQQEENLQTLGEQNRHYRAKLGSFQGHIFNLEKEQLNQKNEIQKLNFERESIEAEAMVLKEELRMIRSEFNTTKHSTTTREPAQCIAMDNNADDSTPDSTPIGVPGARIYSVSFGHPAEILGESNAELDSMQQSSSWERSRQRSIFRSKWSEMDPSLTTPTLDRMEESSDDEWRETRPSSRPHQSDEECKKTNSSQKHRTSGKCSDIQELQQRATQLRETVAKMKLDSPKESTLLSYSEEEDTRDEIAHDNRQSNRALRYFQSKERALQWNTHDNRESMI